jgi:hypothetical protein
VPDAVVYHPARKELRELCVKWDRHIQHAVNSARRKPRWRLRWFARAGAVLGSLFIDWTKVVFSERINGFGPRVKAILVLAAVRVYRAWRMIIAAQSHNEIIWNNEPPAAPPKWE